MKKAIIGAALLLAATPALAAKSTVEFTRDDGKVNMAVFDNTNFIAWVDGGEGIPFTFDEETATLCATPAGGDKEICFTFENASSEVGAVMPYTSSHGERGVAKMLSVSEE